MERRLPVERNFDDEEEDGGDEEERGKDGVSFEVLEIKEKDKVWRRGILMKRRMMEEMEKRKEKMGCPLRF